MTELRFAAAAIVDPREMRAYSKATFGAQVARECVDGLNDFFALLRERPLVGPVQHDLIGDVRRFTCRSHRVIDSVTPELVFIARPRHHAQDERLHRGMR